MIMRVVLLAILLPLAGCGQLATQIVIAGASYVASANNLGAETLKFIDDKEQRSCKAAPLQSSGAP